MNDEHKPAVGYIRMSSDQQQDSPARQRQDIQALAERLGYQILKWYEDHGLTGTESSKRKDFQKLLTDAKAGAFCAVLLSEQSRMSREDVFDAMVHWKQLRDAGVKIVTFQRGELDFSRLQLADLRTKIERGTENLALASREDLPGVSRLLAGWREQEAQLKEQLQRACGDHAPSPEAVAILGRLDDLLGRLNEVDREKLSFTVRQTVKRITLRRERRGDGKHRITLWDGAIELRDDLGVTGVIPLTDDDIPSPGRWREVADFIWQRGDVVYFSDVCAHLGRKGSFVSCLLSPSRAQRQSPQPGPSARLDRCRIGHASVVRFLSVS